MGKFLLNGFCSPSWIRELNQRDVRRTLPDDFKRVLALVDQLCDTDHFEFGFRTDGSSLNQMQTFIKLGNSMLTLDKFSVERANIGGFCVVDVMCKTDKCTNLQCANENGKLPNSSICTTDTHCNSGRCAADFTCRDKVSI